jgi:hypothetical protein
LLIPISCLNIPCSLISTFRALRVRNQAKPSEMGPAPALARRSRSRHWIPRKVCLRMAARGSRGGRLGMPPLALGPAGAAQALGWIGSTRGARGTRVRPEEKGEGVCTGPTAAPHLLSRGLAAVLSGRLLSGTHWAASMGQGGATWTRHVQRGIEPGTADRASIRGERSGGSVGLPCRDGGKRILIMMTCTFSAHPPYNLAR